MFADDTSLFILIRERGGINIYKDNTNIYTNKIRFMDAYE